MTYPGVMTEKHHPGATRQEQRKARTRAKLLRAAQRLVSERGTSSIVVSDITEAADVGTGTFYNYFSSINSLLEDVVQESFQDVGEALDRSVSHMADPADVWSGSLRYLVQYALTEQVWGWFFVNVGAAHPALMSTFGPRARRDLQRGVDEGRFFIDDVDLAVACTFGSLAAAVERGLTSIETTDPDQRYAKAMLQMVGISPAESEQIASRSLPELDIDGILRPES